MTRWLSRIAALAWAGLAALGGVAAQDLSALAYLRPEESRVEASGDETWLTLGLTQPVPYRAFLLDQPPRLVMDFREVDFGATKPETILSGKGLSGLRWGRFRPGWSRLVAELPGPMRLVSVEQATDGPEGTVIRAHLEGVSAEAFAPRVGAPDSALWDLPQPAPVEAARPRQDGSEPLLVVLDPGHGGIDPGADAEGSSEADLVLGFARELKEALRRGGVRVVLTREEDVFIPLETRITVARAAGADLFLSLHADIVPEANVTGATVYLLDDEASDEASQKLAERHDRADLLAGVDLEGHDDEVAHVLMDLARTETQPRSRRLAQVLAGAIKAEGLRMHRRPVQGADFSVLKSPDIPSVLLELGFLSSQADRERLRDPEWRARMVRAIARGISGWAEGDAAEARLLRQ